MFSGLKEKINRKYDQLMWSSAVSVAASMCNHDTFTPFKDCNRGKEIAICGAGPSLNDYKVMEGVKHVALNRALLKDNIKYDYFVADDWEGIRFFADELINYECVKFLGHQIGGEYIRQIPESLVIDSGAKRYYTDCYMLGGYKSKFVCDINYMAIGNMLNVALSAIQIVLFMRPKVVYLVGCDASTDGHFITKTGINEETKKRMDVDAIKYISVNNTINKWKELKDFANAFYPDTTIVSVNPVGLKGLFDDMYQ